MPFWVNYFHVVWATYRRTEMILPEFETSIAADIRQKSIQLNCPIHAINMMSDHIHVAVSIKPSIAPSEWVRQVKGFSARQMNLTYNLDFHFKWQKSFGISTLGKSQLPIVLEYIHNQKQRHANDNISLALENVGDS